MAMAQPPMVGYPSLATVTSARLRFRRSWQKDANVSKTWNHFTRTRFSSHYPPWEAAMAYDLFDELKHAQVGRDEDQPLVTAIIIVLIAFTLYLFL